MTAILAPKGDASITEYVPFGSQDKIKLSVRIVQNLIAVPTRSGKTCSDRDALKFIAMCQSKRLNPFEGDAFLIGFDSKNGAQFTLITAHQAYLKRAELHPEFDGFKSGIVCRGEGGDVDIESEIVPQGMEVVGGWCSVFFKNRKTETTRRIPLSRFKQLIDRHSEYGGPWRDDPAGQICKCAEADSLRSSFPTMLGSLGDPVEQVLSVSGDLESAASKLVEVRNVPIIGQSAESSGEDEQAESTAGLAPSKVKASTHQERLAEFAIQNQSDLDKVLDWAISSGNLDESARDRIITFDDIPANLAERWLKAKTGLLAGLKGGKI